MEEFMRMAIARAMEGVKSGQSPFGACIVKDGQVISCEHNMVWQSTDITAHAEVTAIRKACQKLDTIDLSGSVIYSTTEPCPMCFAACHWAKISKIVYSAKIEDAQKFGFSELTVPNQEMKRLGGSSLEIVPDFLRDETIVLFEAWSARKDKRVY